MNDLSWMIYAADVVDGLSRIATICAAIITTLGVIVVFWAGLMRWDEYSDPEEKERGAAIHAIAMRKAWVPFVLFVLSALIPSSSTIYAIAASEMGEDVLNSETGGKAVEALNAWLDRQIADD